MFSITKTCSIVASLVVFCFSQVYACNPTEMEIAKPSKAVASIPALPLDVVPLILKEASKGSCHPVNFRLVCKDWTTLMDKDNSPKEKNTIKLHGDLMQHCIQIWEGEGRKLWAFERFKNGVLKFTSPVDKKEHIFKFSDLESGCKGTFNLPTCGNTGDRLVITTDLERFIKVGGENENKLLALITLHQVIEQEINSLPEPLVNIMFKWDAAKAPVCIIWRKGNDDLADFDYLTTATLSDISSVSLLEIWRKSKRSYRLLLDDEDEDKLRYLDGFMGSGQFGAGVHVNFLNKN